MKTFLFYAVGLWLIIAAVHRLRRWTCRPSLDGRLFIDKNAKYSRGYMIRGAKASPDIEAERHVSDWLYPKE